MTHNLISTERQNDTYPHLQRSERVQQHLLRFGRQKRLVDFRRQRLAVFADPAGDVDAVAQGVEQDVDHLRARGLLNAISAGGGGERRGGG